VGTAHLIINGKNLMDVTQEVNLAIVELWRQTFPEGTDVLLPLIYPKIKKSVILFIGLNPSFNARRLLASLKGTPFAELNVEGFYSYKNINNYNLEWAKKIVELSRINYPYFKKFNEIAQYVRKDWEHVDLYFYPETSQKIITHKIQNNTLNDFWIKQIELSKKLITEAEPIIIVVVNACASKIFKREFDMEFNKQNGYHEIKLNNKTLPVFLGGMLTGQRALDNYSFERLKWHIGQTIKVM
jgi:hypothetical protein